MSLRAKQTKWRHRLRADARKILAEIYTDTPAGVTFMAKELEKVATRFYKLGKKAGITEGRRRASKDS